MKIVKAFPPNYDEIARHFNIRGMRGVVFTYDDTIYNPYGNELPDHIIEHEQVHMKQQKHDGAVLWWKYYLENADFRFRQELEAYRVQWQYILKYYKDQYERRALLKHLALSLSGKMYGALCSFDYAKAQIENKEAATL